MLSKSIYKKNYTYILFQMTLQMLFILQIVVILVTTSGAYPVFGTKRYNGRSTAVRRENNNYSWNGLVQPYQQFVRTQRFPINYYEMYPYDRDYQDEYYYPQEAISYPVYIPPPRTSKYEVYQAVLPYYYREQPYAQQDYGYYRYDKNADPVTSLEEEMLQETQREEREDAQPIGQEVLYENDNNDDNLDDVNAAFLHNLIMSQMYKDATNKQKEYYDQYPTTDYYFDDDNYAKWDDGFLDPKSYQDDEDVRELKQLAKPQNHDKYNLNGRPTTEERAHTFRKNYSKNSNKNKKPKISKDNIYYAENKRNALTNDNTEKSREPGLSVLGVHNVPFLNRKSVLVPNSDSISTTIGPKSTTDYSPKRNTRGQKEEVLMRPATPVRHSISTPVLTVMKDQPERKREPSVYDTIKHMLDIEKSLENVSA